MIQQNTDFHFAVYNVQRELGLVGPQVEMLANALLKMESLESVFQQCAFLVSDRADKAEPYYIRPLGYLFQEQKMGHIFRDDYERAVSDSVMVSRVYIDRPLHVDRYNRSHYEYNILKLVDSFRHQDGSIPSKIELISFGSPFVGYKADDFEPKQLEGYVPCPYCLIHEQEYWLNPSMADVLFTSECRQRSGSRIHTYSTRRLIIAKVLNRPSVLDRFEIELIRDTGAQQEALENNGMI